MSEEATIAPRKHTKEASESQISGRKRPASAARLHRRRKTREAPRVTWGFVGVTSAGNESPPLNCPVICTATPCTSRAEALSKRRLGFSGAALGTHGIGCRERSEREPRNSSTSRSVIRTRIGPLTASKKT
jgi:hypothetical protein